MRSLVRRGHYWFEKIFGSGITVFVGLIIGLSALIIANQGQQRQIVFLHNTFCGVVEPYSEVAAKNPPPTDNAKALVKGFDTARTKLKCTAKDLPPGFVVNPPNR